MILIVSVKRKEEKHCYRRRNKKTRDVDWRVKLDEVTRYFRVPSGCAGRTACCSECWTSAASLPVDFGAPPIYARRQIACEDSMCRNVTDRCRSLETIEFDRRLPASPRCLSNFGLACRVREKQAHCLEDTLKHHERSIEEASSRSTT